MPRKTKPENIELKEVHAPEKIDIIEKLFSPLILMLLVYKKNEIKKACRLRKQFTGKTLTMHDWILEAIDEKLESKSI